jgi:hypothetical protein
MRADGQPITRAEWREAYESMKRRCELLEKEKADLVKTIAAGFPKDRKQLADPVTEIHEMLRAILPPFLIIAFCIITLAAGPAIAQTPKPGLDAKFKSLLAETAAFYVTDSTQTIIHLREDGYRETNPLYGPHPSAARLFGLGALVDGAYVAGSYELRRHGPRRLRKLWWAPMEYESLNRADAMMFSFGKPRRRK